MLCEITDCYFNMFFVETQLRKENLKSIIWVPEFGCPTQYTGFPNSINMTLIYIYIYIHRHVFRLSQDSSVWQGLTSREQQISLECSKHLVLSFAKMLVVWWTNKKHSALICVLQSAQLINSEHIYPQTRILSFPGLISVAWVNK